MKLHWGPTEGGQNSYTAEKTPPGAVCRTETGIVRYRVKEAAEGGWSFDSLDALWEVDFWCEVGCLTIFAWN